MDKFKVILYKVGECKSEETIVASSPIKAYDKITSMIEGKFIVLIKNKSAIWIYYEDGLVEYYVLPDLGKQK